MSYSACDFLESCAMIAADYDAPEVTREEWERMKGEEIPEDEWEDYCDGEDGQRVLAERIGRAVSHRKDLLAALESLLAAAEGAGNTWDAMNVARAAIQEART